MKDKVLVFKAKEHETWGLSRGNIDLCADGVRDVFPGLPDDYSEVTFVFSQRTHPEACKITFECDKDSAKLWKSMNMLQDIDYEPCFDGEIEYMLWRADEKLRDLWEEGYNYVRAEYVA